MSFWNLSDNSNAAETGGQFETGGGDIEPIPSGTSVLAAPDEAKVDDYQGDSYISLRWCVLQPAEYANRKVFQKIRDWDGDSKKSDKAKRMLAAIDTNAGGKLMAAGKEPDDELLTVALVNRPMVLKLQVWEIETDDGSKKRGNWVSAVSPRTTTAPKPAPAPLTSLNDDAPF
jgi:hypothetical protein